MESYDSGAEVPAMLDYDYLSPDLIQSPRLQTLLQSWDLLRGDASLPSYDPAMRSGLGSAFDFMSCFAVKDAHLYEPRFFIVEHGAGFTELYGSVCAGTYLDQAIPPAHYALAAESHFKTVERKAPIYTVAKSADVNGTPVVTERLYLPFGSPAIGVTHIWLAIEPTSAAEAFVRERLLARPQPPVFVVKAAIETGLLYS